MKRTIILGLTGSVATVLYEKLISKLKELGEVNIILTEKAKHFINDDLLSGVKVYTDADEWRWTENGGYNFTDKWKKDDRVLHIDMINRASTLVIAPCSMNTLGKIANGLCDNLLTSVVRAWDMNRPIIVAPSANTNMWEHPVTKEHIDKLKNWGYKIVMPQSKMLACKTEGMGALAEIDEIVKRVRDSVRWSFPLKRNWRGEVCSGIPTKGHPGAFMTVRKHHTHTGVDLYTNDGEPVYAVEDGIIVGLEDFTGPKQNTPWWNDTRCLLIEGASGVVCYGEIKENHITSKIGRNVKKGDWIGNVERVLKEGKERPDIEGHSTSMLHIELYKHGIHRAFEETGDNLSDWNDLIDPTEYLINAINAPITLLK